MEPEEKKTNGAVVGLIVIITILIIGGIYIWYSKDKDGESTGTNIIEGPPGDF